ncbi:hypothetical protein N9Z12_02490 [Opitutaceae bacterium]|nr:hypothetical protein [Opitutaceae bacterium]
MSFLQRLKSLFFCREGFGAVEDVATLMLAARENDALRTDIEALLNMPDSARAALIHTVVEEMKLKGEPSSARAAFAMLSTPEGAAAARQALQA